MTITQGVAMRSMEARSAASLQRHGAGGISSEQLWSFVRVCKGEG